MKNSTNKILRKLQKEYRRNSGNIVIYIYEEGSQHIDHVDNQYIYTKTPIPQVTTDINEGSDIPDALNTEQAKALWKKAQDVGWVDENFQPKLSLTKSAILASEIAIRLGIKDRWKYFEILWHRKNMRSHHNTALSQKNSYMFFDEVKRMLG